MQKPPIVLHAPSLPNSHLPLLQIAELVSVALSLMIGRGWNAAVTGLIAAEGKSSGHLATEAQVSLVRNYTWYYMLGAMTAAVLLSGWYANEFPTKLKKAITDLPGSGLGFGGKLEEVKHRATAEEEGVTQQASNASTV